MANVAMSKMYKGVMMELIKKKVHIQLHTIIDDQGEKELSTVKQKGDLFKKGKFDVLIFTEEEEDFGEIKNHITITPEKITVKRSGAVSMNQQFIPGKKSECVYRHPYGNFHMELHTHTIQRRQMKDDNKTEIIIKYDAVINGQEPRLHHVTLMFTEENE